MQDNWRFAALNELLIPISRPEAVNAEKTYHILGAHWYATGLYTKHIKTGAEIQATTIYRVEEGDFVYNRLFAWKGSFAIANAENHGCYVSNEFPCFSIRVDYLDPLYLWHYFSRETAWNEVLGLSSGSTPTSRNRLKEKDLLAIQIPLPPLDEQRRIITHIEALAARVAEARGLRHDVMEETEALFVSKLNDQTDDLLKHNSVYRLEDVTEFIGDMLHEMPKQVEQGIPFISPINFTQEGGIDFSTAKQIHPDDFMYYSKKCKPQRGDILLARYGTVGATRLVETDIEFLASYSIVVIRPKFSEVRSDYLYYLISSPLIQEQALAGVRGGVQPDLGIKTIRNFNVPVPPVNKQHQVVAYLDELRKRVDALKQLQTETISELDALLPSLLDRAFKGEL